MNADRRALLAGCVLLLALGTFLARHLQVATDITHFLPEGADTSEVQLARELAAGELSRTMVLLIDAPDPVTAARASRTFEAELRGDPVIVDGTARLVGGSGESLENAMWQTYAPHRLAFLADDATAARRRLTDEALAAAAADLRRKLASPMSTMLTRVAPGDPLLILPALFERFMGARGEGLKLVDGRFVTEDEHGAVLFLTTSTPTSDASALRPLVAAIEAAFARVAAQSDGRLTLLQSGTHLFALAAEESIRFDIQRVGIGSSIGLLLLFLLVFRSLRLMLLVLPILASGFLVGTSACLLLFGSVHGLTLAFGAALIGVSVDYGVHFHCHHLCAPAGQAPRQTLRGIWPGLLLGATTTITGFLVLMASSFPGLRQLAVFAACGIATAALSTWLFLPGLAGASRGPTPATAWLVHSLRRLWFDDTVRRRWLLVPVLVVAAVAAIGLPQLRWNDGLADLNRVDPAIEAVDRSVRERVVRFEQRRLVVATGVDEEAALQANDGIARVLTELQHRGELAGFRSLAAMLPSQQQQRAVQAEVRTSTDLWPRLSAALAAAEFRPAAFEPWRELVAAEPPAPLTYADLITSPLRPLVEPFRFSWSGGVGFVSFLHDLQDEQALRAALADIPGARLIDIEGALSSAYGDYRERLLELWLFGLCAVLLLVALRHRALRPTLIAYVPAVLSAAGTVGLLALCGLELNMLSLVALLMVVSMGVDYGVFLAEHHENEPHRDATLLAVVLAGLSTMLGFGLLALSSQPPLFHIGLTSGIGVLLCLLLAPTICALSARRAP